MSVHQYLKYITVKYGTQTLLKKKTKYTWTIPSHTNVNLSPFVSQHLTISVSTWLTRVRYVQHRRTCGWGRRWHYSGMRLLHTFKYHNFRLDVTLEHCEWAGLSFIFCSVVSKIYFCLFHSSKLRKMSKGGPPGAGDKKKSRHPSLNIETGSFVNITEPFLNMTTTFYS